MPRISAERQESARRRILQAAKGVFIDKGFDRATVDDVATAAGFSAGSIYTYFASKDELIRASIDAGAREETELLLAETRSVGSIPERLERSFSGFWAGTMDVPGGPAFLAEAWAEASRRPLIRDLMARRFERTSMFCSVVLREGIDSGELPVDLDVDALARGFAAMLDGLVVEYVISGGTLRRADAQKRIRLIMDAVMHAAGPA